MTDAINLSEQDDGQSIPSALAATPASKKLRVRTAKPAKPVDIVAAPMPESIVEAAQVAEPALEASPEPERIIEPTPEPLADIVAAPEPAPGPAAVVVEPVPLSTPTAAVSAAPQKESIMATTIENVTNATAANTAKAQAFFTDANERAKGAVAKSTKLFEEATAFGKGNVEALVESSKIAAKGFETMGQDAAEYSRKQFEEATAAFKTLASVKSPTEFLKLHGDFVRASFDSMVAETSRSTETMLKLAGEVVQPISNRIAVAAEKMKTAA